MRKILFSLALFLLIGINLTGVKAQSSDYNVKPSVISGEVISTAADKIVLQTKDGAMNVTLSGKTEFKRVTADNPSLKTAAASNLSDIAVGDKLIVTGIASADKKSIPARSVYLMTKGDIAEKQTKEQEQWRTRGISGKVTLVNAQAKQLTVSTRGLMGERLIVITPKDDADFRRYAPDSVRFSEAKQSNLAEIKPGDMIRALGDKNVDGTAFSAERVVTGSFQTIGGTIKAIDTAKKEITITDVQTKKDIIIAVGDNSVLKQFPAEMAQRLAMMQSGGGMQPGGAGGQGGMRPPRTGAQNVEAGAQNSGEGRPAGQGGGGMRGGGGSIDDMLDRFPNISINDLKVGEMIAASSTKGSDLSRVTAIKLLSGVEPFLKSAASGGRQGGQRGGGQDPGFTIPGLDGIGLP